MGALPADIALELTTMPGAPAVFITLAPGQSERFVDLVGQAFGANGVLSTLRIVSEAGRNLEIRSIAYAIANGELTPPQTIDIYGASTWYPLRVLEGLDFTDQERTNIGLLNLSESDAEFVLALQRVPGRNLAINHLRVPPGSLTHAPIQSLFPLITQGDGFTVIIETANPETHVYASVIDNTSHVARFVAPRPGNR
jgi:hypothetical protein